MFRKHRTAGAVLGALMVISVWAIAAGTGPQAKTIPYRGHVELNGVPLNGNVNMTFTLYDDSDVSADTLSWSETKVVAPVAGDFAVILGSMTPIPPAAFVATSLYLQVSVEGTPLSGLQPILPVASAHRADRADALTVKAIRDADGVRATYDHTPARWVIEATYDSNFAAFNTASRVATLDQQMLVAYCGDLDGCTLRLFMENWDALATSQTQASTAPVHFHYNEANGAWRITQFTNNHALPNPGFEDQGVEYAPTTDLDGNGVYARVLRAWNCFLADAFMNPGDVGAVDGEAGFQLQNFNANLAYTPTCRVVIDD